jgi:hypothetical protein
MKQIERRIRKLEASGPARQWGYVVACDRPIEDLDLSKVDLDSYPFKWVNGNKAVWVAPQCRTKSGQRNIALRIEGGIE